MNQQQRQRLERIAHRFSAIPTPTKDGSHDPALDDLMDSMEQDAARLEGISAPNAE